MAHISVKVGKRKKASHEIDHLEVKKGENGGHIIEHHFNNDGIGEYQKPEPHVFGEKEGVDALAHIAHHMGMKGDGDGDEGEE